MIENIEAKPLKVVIVGAGAAGYFVAAALKRNCPNVDVTIVHDPNTPYIGVGESIAFNCRDVMRKLYGIEDDNSYDWMKKSQSSYKYGVAFFGFDGTDTPMVSGFQWNPSARVITQSITDTYGHRTKALGPASGNYNDQYTLWDVWLHLYNKGLRTNKTRAGDLSESYWYSHYKTIMDQQHLPQKRLVSSFHFNADYVKDVIHENIGIPCGVKVQALKIKNVVFDGTRVTHLVGEDDSQVHADLFVDCTGFKRLFSQFVPFRWKPVEDTINNSAIVGQGPNRHNLENPSDCVSRHYAMSQGWVFGLPQPRRSGNGYVYNKNFTTDEQQLVDEFDQRFPWMKGAIKRKISWQAGFFEETFVANCVTLGISSGFTDVYDANGFSTQLAFIDRLVDHIKQDVNRTFDWQDSYNQFVNSINNDVLKRIQVGMYLAPKNNTPYWQLMNSIGQEIKIKEWLQDTVISNSRRYYTDKLRHFWYQGPLANMAMYYNIDLPWQIDIDSQTEKLAINFFDYFSNKNKIQAMHAQSANDWYNNFFGTAQ